MEPGVAFIGLGVMGHRMLESMRRYGGFRPSLGWDPDSEACRRFHEALPALSIAESAQAAIESAETDIVYIACPPAYHKDHALAALRAGKPIFCEKPLGVDLPESRALVDAVEASEIKTAVNFPFAEAAAVEAMVSALKDGAIGTVEAVDIRLHFCQWPRDWQEPAAWLSQRDQGGFVRETFSHYAFLTRKLFGKARLVEAINRYPDDDVSAERQSLALFDCSGTPVTFAGGVGGPASSTADRVEFTIWGSQAAYRLSDWNRLSVHRGQGWEAQLTEIADPRQDGYRRMLENLGRWYRGEAHSMPDFREALAVQALVEATLQPGK